MSDDKSGRQLAIPRSGSQKLVLNAAGAPDSSKEIVLAAWQTPNKGIPKRMVIRIDGNVIDENDKNGAKGFPCAMVQVRYSIGGYVREVFIDATNQSALTVWAETIEVQALWDPRRIARLLAQYSVLPDLSQMVAAAISGCECGDTGIADARWLDVLNGDTVGETTVISLHPVPNGARGVRFLNGIAGGAIVRMANVATMINFYASKSVEANAFVETANNNVTDQAIINVPTTARLLAITLPDSTLDDLDSPAFIEWVMAPMTGSYY